jgi:cardiolipin synthase
MLSDLPNLLTLSRIAVIPVIVVLMAIGKAATDAVATLLFVLAAITDYLDGKLARDWRKTSDFGRMLDPIADKLLVGAVLMMLVGTNRLGQASLYPAIIIMLREILVSGLREYLAQSQARLPVTRLAKWKTGVQLAALGALIGGEGTARLIGLGWLPVEPIGLVLLWLAALLTLITGWEYLLAGLRQAGKPAAAGLTPPRAHAPEG